MKVKVIGKINHKGNAYVKKLMNDALVETADAVKNAGANILVSGTAILIAKDFKVIIDELRG